MAAGQVDIVPAVQQLGAPDRIDREGRSEIAENDAPASRSTVIAPAPSASAASSASPSSSRDLRRQQPVIDGVGREDVAEARGDDAADPVIDQRVDGRLARGAAAEIAPRDQQPGAVRVPAGSAGNRAARTPFSSKRRSCSRIAAIAFRPRALHEARRDQLVGVDAGERQRAGEA